MKQDLIIVLDLGSDENGRIARTIRRLGVYSEIHHHDISRDELASLQNLRGVIVNGGKNNIVDGKPIDILPWLTGYGLPLLFIDHPDTHGDPQYDLKSVHRHISLPEDDDALDTALRSFLFEDCRAQANWNMSNFIDDQIESIRLQVGDKKVLQALSGGVDSSVIAALLIKAIGDQAAWPA